MSKIITKFTFLGLLMNSIFHANAETRKAIVFGGGCEDPHENRLSHIMATQIKGLKKNGWEVMTLFDESASTDELSERSGLDKNQIQDASKETLLLALDTLLADKNMKDGSTVFISFNTHGQPRSDGLGHQLCIRSDSRNPDSPMKMMDLDDPDILLRLKELKKRKVKMGFSDMSCFSGASIPILAEFGCVVSSQTSNLPSSTYGVAGSIAALLNATESEQKKKSLNKDGKITLEDIYMDALINGADYNPVGFNRPTSNPQQATSSIFRTATPYQNALIDILEPRSPHFPKLSKEEVCLKKEASLEKIETFLSNLESDVLLRYLEDLSGQKIHSLSEFRADLLRRIAERKIVEDQYNELGLEEKDIGSKLYRFNFHFQSEMPPEIMPIQEHFNFIYSQGAHNSEVTNIKSGIVEFKARDLPEFTKEDAHEMHTLLVDRAQIPVYALDPAKIPSPETLHQFLKQIGNDFKASVDKDRFKEYKTLEHKYSDILSKINTLRSQHPFLQGIGPNQISRDFSLLTGHAYLHERQKWLHSKNPPKEFEACRNFVLN